MIRRILPFVLLFAAGNARAIEPLEKQTAEFFPLALNGALTLENIDGAIHIFGCYEPRVRLAALRRAYTEPRLQQIRIETKSQPDSLAIRTMIPPVPGLLADRSGTVEYTVNVPETARLNLKLVNGEITLDGLRGGSASIELVNGRITARNCYAQVRAHSVHGVMEVFYEWWENLPAAFDYAMEQGRIGARLPKGARFRVSARTANGGIHNEFHFSAPAKAGSGQSLEAATAPDAPVSLGLRTGGGNISIDKAGGG